MELKLKKSQDSVRRWKGKYMKADEGETTWKNKFTDMEEESNKNVKEVERQ